MGSPISKPDVNVQLLPAPLVSAFNARRNLIIGQTGATGSAVDKELVLNIEGYNSAQLLTAFGEGELYWRIISWQRAVNVANSAIVPQLDVISVARATAAVQAAATAVFAGTATAAGTVRIDICDTDKFGVTVSIPSGTAGTAVADLVVAALSNLTNPPFSAVNATGTVTVTADDHGTVGNYFGISATSSTPGVTVIPTAFAGGLTDPVLTDSLDAIEGIRYTGLSWPENWQESLDIPKDLFDGRFNASNTIIDGVVFTGHSATFANATSFVDAQNSQSLVIAGNNVVAAVPAFGPVIMQPADWTLAAFMGIRAKRLTAGSQIADLLISPATLDATGGAALASLAYHNTPLSDTPVTLATDQFTNTEQVNLRDDGFTTYGVNRANNFMIMGDAVTTRTTDAAGNTNDSFLYLNYVDTGSVCREIFFNVLKAKYAQSRLTEGDLIAGRSIENASSIKEQLIQVYLLLAQSTLVQAGSTAVEFFRSNTTVTVNLATRTVDIGGPLPIVTQIGTINYNLYLSFTVGQTGLQITL
jgi:phage tail sheath gpL-like